MSRALRINGLHHVITIFERAGELRVQIYLPRLSRRNVLILSPRQRLELLGSTNWGQKEMWIQNVIKRLSLKGPIKSPKDQRLVFNRTIYSLAKRIGNTYMTMKFDQPEDWKDDKDGGVILH